MTTTCSLSLFDADELMPAADVPDLTAFDVILVNSSAGKDSQAMLDYVVDEAILAGVLDRVVVVHADLGRVEWPGTRELAAEHAAHYGLRFEVVQRSKGLLLEQVTERHESNLRRGKIQPPWPSSAARWCTSDQKTSQVLRLMTRLVDEIDPESVGRRVRILNCLGIRAEESAARARKAMLGPDSATNETRRDVTRWLPIFHWSEAQVWERIRLAGTRHHPAYDAGMPRLSCSFCVLASRSALVRAAQLRPDLAAEYVAKEAEVGYRFRADVSMGEIVEEAERSVVPVTIAAWSA